jgi:hypothetical protein
MKLRISYPRNGKLITITIVFILGTIFTLFYNSFQMNYQYFRIIPSTLLITSKNTTSIKTINDTKPM